MDNLSTTFREQLQEVLIRADMNLGTISDLLGRSDHDVGHWLRTELPYQLSLLEDLAELCNHEVEVRFVPKKAKNVKVVELLRLADAYGWQEHKNALGEYDIVNDDGRVMMSIKETPQGLEVFITPMSEKFLLENLIYRKR